MLIFAMRFCSLIRIFSLREKIGCISEMKINQYLFCISLDFHYLCSDINININTT